MTLRQLISAPGRGVPPVEPCPEFDYAFQRVSEPGIRFLKQLHRKRWSARQVCIWSCLALWWLTSTLEITAQVDQEHLPPSDQEFHSGVNPAFDLQQEFTPTLDRVNFVQLFFNMSGISILRQSASFTVSIRDGGVDGAIIGTSSELDLSPEFQGFATFRFADPTDLSPNEKYAFDVRKTDGKLDFWTVEAGSLPGYAGGDLQFNGSIESGADLYFREGIAIPEPAPVLLVCMSAAGLGFFRILKNLRRYDTI